MLYFVGSILIQNADPGILLDVLSCNSNIYRISILADKEPDNVQADV